MRMNWFSIDEAYILVEITNAGSANYHVVVWSVMYFLSDLNITRASVKTGRVYEGI